MRTNLIIGAGQIGSRHLQGLLKYPEEQKIYLLDPSHSSLNLAKQRSQEIEHLHQLYFVDQWKDLPESFDIVIIATNSDVRGKVLLHLATYYDLKYLILEKVLFQEIETYHKTDELLKKYNIPAWVNHPRRLFKSYRQIKNILHQEGNKIMQFTGGNWGLACNSLHLIDLFSYLTGSCLKSLNTEGIDQGLIPSKRKGYIEFTGILTGRLANESSFQLNSVKGETTPGTMLIFDPETKIIIQELFTPQIIIMQKEKMFKAEVIPFEMEFQSSLTTKIAESLFKYGYCDLTSYEQSFRTHEIFIREMLDKYNEITGAKQFKLPVT